MMDRLLYLHLEVWEGRAGVALNGVPVLRAQPAGALRVMPVHEFLQTGVNQLQLAISGKVPGRARAQLLLVRDGRPVDAAEGKLLGDLSVGEPDAPVPAGTLRELGVELPVNFPRWRWMDLKTEALANDTRGKLQEWLLSVAEDLARGQVDALLDHARLRSEEIAQAYKRDPGDIVRGLRDRLTALHAAGGLRWPKTLAADVRFEAVAGGRLLECLGKDDQAALSTQADENGIVHRFPLRVAVFDGRIHVLR